MGTDLQKEANTLNTGKRTTEPPRKKIRYEEELNGGTSNQSSVHNKESKVQLGDSLMPTEKRKVSRRGSTLQNDAEELQEWLESESDEDEDENKHIGVTGPGDSRLPTVEWTEELDTDTWTWVADEDRHADLIMQRMLPTEHLAFDWSSDYETFKGTREMFTGRAGPTFPVTQNTRPIEIFLKYCDDDFFELLTTQTNRHVTLLTDTVLTPHSRLNDCKNVDRDELAVFLAILILQGLAPLPVEQEYWQENGYLTMPLFKGIMTYNRFVILKRVIYFSDAERQTTGSDDNKLWMISPVLDLLKKKFSELYLPGQDIVIDESLLKWQGRLSFLQKIATKAAKVCKKSYELSDLATGYLWSFYVYTGKPTQTDENDRQTERSQPVPSKAKIVHELAKPLFNRGHTLVMDNFYNSPLLARYLKSQGTDCYGTLRVNRAFVPESIKRVSAELRPGELVQSCSRDLNVMMWHDNTHVVSMLSTFHEGFVGGKDKFGKYKYKPQILLDYNHAMGRVDKKDQLLASFPIERTRNLIWYKKVFRRLLNITLLNSYIVYKSVHKDASQRYFRRQIAEDLIKMGKPPVVECPLTTTVNIKKYVNIQKKMRPILQGNHYVGTGTTKYSQCCWCKKRRTKYLCKQCNVSVCLEACFEEYHTIPQRF